jgi:hypothetical protein
MTDLDHGLRPGRWAIVAWCAMLLCGCEAARGPSAPSIVASENPSPEAVSPTPTPPPAQPQPVPRAIVTGDYEVTFLAQNCIQSDRPLLPRELRTRTFSMRVEQTGADIWVLENAFADSTLVAVDALALWGDIASDGTVALTNYYGNDQWKVLRDQVTPDRAVWILVERMRVALSPEGVLTVGNFDGYFESRHRGRTDVVESDCLSTSHAVTFVPDVRRTNRSR